MTARFGIIVTLATAALVLACAPAREPAAPLAHASQEPGAATSTEGGLPSDRPVIVVIRAEWCASCRHTAPAVAWLHSEYGDRVSFVDLDLTDERTTRESALIAERLGLRRLFEENGDSVGVTVLGRERKTIRRLIGERHPAPYRQALEAAFASFERPTP